MRSVAAGEGGRPVSVLEQRQVSPLRVLCCGTDGIQHTGTLRLGATSIAVRSMQEASTVAAVGAARVRVEQEAVKRLRSAALLHKPPLSPNAAAACLQSTTVGSTLAAALVVPAAAAAAPSTCRDIVLPHVLEDTLHPAPHLPLPRRCARAAPVDTAAPAVPHRVAPALNVAIGGVTRGIAHLTSISWVEHHLASPHLHVGRAAGTAGGERGGVPKQSTSAATVRSCLK